MKYFEVLFSLNPYSTDACDVLAALAGEAGFETFMETENGLTGYVQQALFDESALKEALEDFPFEEVSISYEIQEAEDRDWNEQWEQEGFEPIEIRGKKDDGRGIIIHDGRHLPETISEQDITIEIDAKLAFGTGTHETTRMVCATLNSILRPGPDIKNYDSGPDPSIKKVLDCGTGTGILAICALKLGAQKAVGYDIDEWSVDNARHNAVINGVDKRFTSLLGDVTILKEMEDRFDLIMANINRNILLADMPIMHQKMALGARLILSGFYTADIPMLTEKAKSLGMTLVSQKEDHDWACLVFKD
jgi:ribosomal protein L11 methyltransferase